MGVTRNIPRSVLEVWLRHGELEMRLLFKWRVVVLVTSMYMESVELTCVVRGIRSFLRTFL